ncbi:ribose-phosphate pyrophosphokinase [Natranaerovirga hydrolytica]|uniref:ribose-phosphate diphosphokinase n=1 Tax=Natranaerovirga hydrolytica TaxID=680378 RepID=A0A4R1N6D6_9FIRM|nr:ribose-phosphate diphosphokinase [Natranaerovirga hydrolytica]TCK98193.1 ribose-phosphate pyrophosphokinase [Natranaerovirga hydrolytica]
MEIKIFAGSSGKEFAQKICDYLGTELGKSRVFTFTEGNTYVKADETVRDKDVYLVQSIGLHPNNEFTEILFWVDAFKRASANTVTVVMPYFSYAKGDKKDEPRVSIRGRVCAECIELAGADRVVTMDLHSPQIQGFFKKPVDHLFALPILCEYVKTLNLDDLVVVSPDSGFTKEARNYAKYLKTSVAIGDKERDDHSENAKIVDIVGDVEGKNALIVDDFSISGGTLIDVARTLKEKGAKKIYAALSHVLLTEKGVQKLEDSPIELLISTDSVNNPYIQNSDKVKIVSVAPLFAETIGRIDRRESVSPLFNEVPNKIFENI